MAKPRVDKKNNAVFIPVNPKIYPLPIIYQAADVFIDRAHVILDGNPERSVVVMMKPKAGKADLEGLAGEFNNELLNYAAYFVRSQINKDLKDAIIKRAFMTASGRQEGPVALPEQKRIDLGTKVPLVADDKKKRAKKTRAESGIFAVWEKQKGAIKKEPERLR